MGVEDGEVCEVFGVGLEDCGGGCGRGGFEADGGEDDLAGWVVFGDGDGVEGGVDDADVGALGAGFFEGVSSFEFRVSSLLNDF